MKTTYFTVGPSQLYPTVNKHALDALNSDVFSISHTTPFFVETYKGLEANLKRLFNIPNSHHIFFTGSSTESMHTIIASTVEHACAHIITGGFSEKFYKSAIDLHKKPTRVELSIDDTVDLATLTVPDKTELLCITENDTSIGLRLDLDGLKALKVKHKDILIAVDIVSSVPYVELDYSVVDIAFFSVHKGLGLPAGLGILIVNDNAIQKAAKLKARGVPIGGHHSFVALAEKEVGYKTPETPNVFNIFLLEKVTSDLLDYGLGQLRKETDQKAAMIYDFFDAHPIYKPLIQTKHRSATTPVIDVRGDASQVVSNLGELGFVVSKGYKPHEQDHLRIANFPAHSVEDVKSLLVAIDRAI